MRLGLSLVLHPTRVRGANFVSVSDKMSRNDTIFRESATFGHFANISPTCRRHVQLSVRIVFSFISGILFGIQLAEFNPSLCHLIIGLLKWGYFVGLYSRGMIDYGSIEIIHNLHSTLRGYIFGFLEHQLVTYFCLSNMKMKRPSPHNELLQLQKKDLILYFDSVGIVWEIKVFGC